MYRLRIGIFIALIALLAGCGNNASTSEEAGASQTEISSHDMGSENTVGESDADDAVEEETGITEQEATVYLKSCATYQDILDNAYEVIVADRGADIVVADGLFSYIGICEAGIGRDTNEALSAIGYTLYDVDGNGTEELIIADTGEGVWDNRIMLMYTIHDGKPVLLIDGWARNTYYLLKDNTIFNEGSGGAAYTIFATYHMAENGIDLDIIDYYYSGYYGDSEWGWFHNTTGEMTEDESEIIEFEDENTFINMMDSYYAQVKELELTFFDSMQ